LHFGIGTYDRVSLKIYVDGVLENSVNAAGAIDTGTSPVLLGDRPVVSGAEYAGDILKFYMLNRALSAAEVKRLSESEIMLVRS